jgi:hypothetical protein
VKKAGKTAKSRKQKTPAKKAPAKKASAKKTSAKKAKNGLAKTAAATKPLALGVAPKKPAARSTGSGCCTITGLEGPNRQFERISKGECERRARALGGNPHWVAGDCA